VKFATRTFHLCLAASALVLLSAVPGLASPLATESQAALPYDVQQLIVVDYQQMINSNIAMQLQKRVLPPELKRLQDALQNSGIDVAQSVDQLAFASYRVPKSQSIGIVGIASGQFPTTDILANFKKKKIKGTKVRTSMVYPMGNSGMSVVFPNQTTMIFGSLEAVKASLDARDSVAPSFLTNNDMQNLIPPTPNEAVWSILDSKGTNTMMQSVMGPEATQVADFSAVKKRLLGSRYTMDFEHGVKFNLDVMTPDAITAATMSSVLSAAALYKKMGATPAEKTAIDDTNITSTGSTLEVHFSASDNDFATLLQSPLFQSVVH
jgi:hypothetical protein